MSEFDSSADDIKANPFLEVDDVEDVSVSVVRGKGELATLKGVEDPEREIIELELSDGLRWISTPQQYQEDYPEAVEEEEGDYTINVPESDDATTQRGLFKSALKLVRRIRLKDRADLPRQTALALAEKLEEKLDPGPGLYRIEHPTKILGRAEKSDFKAGKPALVMIHGTGSSTEGSFSPFVMSQDKDSDALELDYWKHLTKQYQGRIFALEHQSLSKSPLFNARDFLDIVPQGSRIHLISHSRGGLVGEIISRANIKGRPQAFDDDEFSLFQKALIEADDSDHKQAILDEMQLIHEINALFGEKKLNVERFVRVACPAAGTNLMTRRADVFFNILLNAIGLIPPLRMNPVYGFLKAFLMEVVKNRFKPEVLPGLAAQRPTSPLVQALNNPRVQLESELAVISGNARFANIFKKLAVFVSRLVFWERSDLVVHTRSMYGGAGRTKAYAYFQDDSRNISHFRYFKNEKSRTAIAEVINNDSDERPSFQSISAEVRRGKRAEVKVGGRPIDKAPVVFVLPGIMGSDLSAKGAQVWLKPTSLAWGGIDKITVDSNDVTASGMISHYYADLIEHLKGSFHVIPFPFDWRLSITESAVALGQHVSKVLGDTSQPVSFLAHSMGGLVVRQMIALQPEVWGQITDRHGRLVMLGTPNQGSFSVIRTLMGENWLIKLLSLMDVRNSEKDILKIIANYNGLLEMLPLKALDPETRREKAVNYFDKGVWTAWRQVQRGAVLPTAPRLLAARKLFGSLDESTLDPRHMVYVAGQAKETPASIRIGARGNRRELQFLATREGDGTVTWKSGLAGRLEDVTYYSRADHGNLPCRRADFAAFVDLLQRGKTRRLPRQPQRARSAAGEELTVMQPEGVEYIPDEHVLLEAAFGARSHGDNDDGLPVDVIQVSVSLGDLAHSRFPVVVGHYKGDAIVHAEKALNWHLDGRLEDFMDMDVYPGEPGTSLVILNENNSPSGGIIVGLGKFGELSQDKVIQSVQHGLVSYAMKWCQSRLTDPAYEGERGVDERETLGVSTLLIGAGPFSSLSTYTSIRCILQAAMQANKQIANANKEDKSRTLQRIAEVEFVELYEDRAIQIMHSLHGILENEMSKHFRVKREHIKRIDGARKRLFDVNMDWWHRVKVEEAPRVCEYNPRAGDEPMTDPEPPLRFSLLTQRARAEESTTYSNRQVIQALLRDGEIPSEKNGRIAKTLFQLLLPNAFKEFLMDGHNLIWVVDDEAAEYPWEMLDAGWSEDREPLSLQSGMIRQLVTENYRPQVETAMTDSAFIVGDPVSDMVPLDGAVEEARMVKARLSKKGFKVTSLQREEATPQATITGLFNPEGYRILHLAGHGVFQYGERKETGMVIGEDLILTPGTITQMQFVPELAFINCCYLGKADDDQNRKNRHKLAANLGTELIRMGVRCVIAAGWEVSDTAALEFANRFYSCMLDGYQFGEAVRRAREAAYEVEPDSNTWGAYQAYGDPYYKLMKSQGGGDARHKTYVDPEEAILELENIGSMARSAQERYFKYLQSRLAETITSIPKAWQEGEAAVIEAIANAYGELELFEDAIVYYHRLSSMESATFSFRALETRANLTAKLAFKQWVADDGRKMAQDSIREAIDFLEYITRSQKKYVTAHRCSLLGSAWKRRAVMRSKAQRPKDLVEAAGYYASAFIVDDRNSRLNHYSALNWLTLNLLLNTFYLDSDSALTTEEQIQEVYLAILKEEPTYGASDQMQLVYEDAVSELKAVEGSDPSFWNISGKGDLALYEYLRLLLGADDMTEENTLESKKEVIEEAYLQAWRRSGTYKNRNAVLEQFDWLIFLLNRIQEDRKGKGNKPALASVASRTVEALDVLHGSLQTLMSDRD